ncbi:hypothetical protein GY45DRAFT_680779 [Cubamyces sp. BRFM 1775]|nr:hypothetical protein GY45DRAFT_680779 [Cubamyces sp. BRFM 1775]
MADTLVIARKAIEDDIFEHEKAIIDLKGRLNTMTTIARLPPELLSEVFLYVAKAAYEDPRASYNRYYHSSIFYAWVSVTHVCRNWRAIALNTPRLWGHVVVSKKSVVDEMLARSKKAPLFVSAHVISPEDERSKLLKSIGQDASRLQELRLSGPVRVLQDVLRQFTEPSPALERLIVSESVPPQYWASDTSAPSMFQAQHPSLRYLELSRLIFSWTNSLLSSSGVTHLKLVGRLDSQSMLGTFEHLLSAIEQMPRLEVLDLEDAIPRLPDDTKTLPTPQRTLSLPRLQRLSLSGNSLDCGNLLNHLSFPSGTRLKFIGRGGVGATELLRVVSQHLRRSEPLRSARLCRMYTGRIEANGWREVLDPKRSKHPCVELQVDTLACSSVASYLVNASKIFAGVHNLDVEALDHNWRWKDVFAGMPELRVLAVSGDPQEQFIQAISATRKGRRNSPPTLVLPHLRVLKLEDTRMCSPDYDDPPEFLDKLEDWLIMRCNYDLPIDELHLDNCLNLTDEDVERLDEVVPYVKWDGMVNFESEDEEDEEHDDFDEYPYDDYDYDFDGDDYFGDPWGFF